MARGAPATQPPGGAHTPRPSRGAAAERDAAAQLAALEEVQRRVLWLAISIVHHANKVRQTASGVKVGGHQASSASMVSIMSALYFEHLRAPDRVSVKPHAAPVLHAINYLLGRLDESYLTQLRSFGGLQSYPSRAKDPDPVDFSTGSVGIGATATLWSALAHRYVAGHFEVPRGGRQVALLGDAELDEGAIWEALVDPLVAALGEVLWIVDLNRQSLDRVVPDIAVARTSAMFEAAGWQTITVKYGHRLRALFARAGGEALRERIDAMPNEEYQRLLRGDAAELRERLPGSGRGRRELARLIKELDDVELAAAIRDLGGHDLADLLDAFRRADQVSDRPAVIFAYTIKAWGLPTEGHPANHSALLSSAQWEQLAQELGADTDDPWARFAPGTPPGLLCAGAAERLARAPVVRREPPAVPPELGRSHTGAVSTQQAFGRFFVDLAHAAPEVAARRDGQPRRRLFDEPRRLDQPRRCVERRRAHRLVRRRHTTRSCAGARASTASTSSLGSPRATSWVCWASSAPPGRATGSRCCRSARCTTRSSTARSSRGRSASTRAASRSSSAPRRASRSRPRAARTSRSSRPRSASSSRVASPGSPHSARTSSGALLHALARLGRADGTSAYFRLSTRPIDQALARVPEEPAARERRREHVLAGGYRCARHRHARGHARRHGRHHAGAARRRRRARRPLGSPSTSCA